MSLLASRGDTIIEVLLAVTVFSAVSVMAMQLMQSGTNSAQRTLEITHVKQQIDSQVDALRTAQQAYMFAPEKADLAAESPERSWKSIVTDSDTGRGRPTIDKDCPKGTDYNNTFYMNPKTAMKEFRQPVGFDVDTAPLYARVRTDPPPASYGIWIEKHDVALGAKAADFYVRACWYAPGASLPMQLQTIVRLNYGT